MILLRVYIRTINNNRKKEICKTIPVKSCIFVSQRGYGLVLWCLTPLSVLLMEETEISEYSHRLATSH